MQKPQRQSRRGLHSARRVDAPLRELAFRENDGIEVTLIWDAAEDRVLVGVSESRADESFVCSVAPAEALDAFHHPFAYAARRHSAGQLPIQQLQQAWEG